MDNEKNCADLLYAMHRFGTSRSQFVDNVSSGGIFAQIDIETGVMTKAKTLFTSDYTSKGFCTHPDTKSQIEGVKIPNWEEIVDRLLYAHQCFPYYKFFAWDVTIDEKGEPWILEINRGSDLNSQSISPLRHTKLGEWMKSNGLLDHF